jgi:hypothetical protein
MNRLRKARMTDKIQKLVSIGRAARWMSSLIKAACVWILITAVFLTVSRPAYGQFGIDIGIIEAGLQAIQKALVRSVGTPLQSIESVEKDWSQFEQTVVYSQAAILQAKNFVASLANPMQQMNQTFSMNYSSAQLPAPQQLEQQLLSRDPNQIANIGDSFHQVYGALPANTQAPQNVLNAIDITDAEAEDGLKKAIQLDALAQQEQEVAQQLQQQIQQAAPGSAPIFEAEAAAWVVRANSYTQSAMAELMRVRSAGVANQSALLKSITASNLNTNQNLQQMLNVR